MLTLRCRKTVNDYDYVFKGETEEEILKNRAEHALEVRVMKAEDVTLMDSLSISYAKLLGKL